MPQHLEGFKETTETKIAGYESTICTAITTDWTETKTHLEKEQHSRSRDIIQEIVENTTKFSNENGKFVDISNFLFS